MLSASVFDNGFVRISDKLRVELLGLSRHFEIRVDFELSLQFSGDLRLPLVAQYM